MSHRRPVVALVPLAVAGLLGVPAAPAAAAPALSPVFRVDSQQSGAPLRGVFNASGAMSGTGRYITYTTRGAAVPGDTNGGLDIYRLDRGTSTVVRVSVPVRGASTSGGGRSLSASTISRDGRYVAFASDADNLVKGDTDSTSSIFLRDVDRATTTQVDLTPTGAPGNGRSIRAQVSGDGTHVVFCTNATDLLPTSRPATYAVMIRDLRTGVTRQVDVGTSGAPATRGATCKFSVSADGSKVAFVSPAPGLASAAPASGPGIPIYVRDLTAGTTAYVAQSEEAQNEISLSGDGRTLVYDPPDRPYPNASCQVRVMNLVTGAAEAVARSASGQLANGCSYVNEAAVSHDGSVIAFSVLATNLAPGDNNRLTDSYVRNRRTGEVSRTSTRSSGAQLDHASYDSQVSADGRVVTFATYAAVLPDDDNARQDVYGRQITW